MDDLRDRFASFDLVPVPDLWSDVERRLEALGTAATKPLAAGKPEWRGTFSAERSPGLAPSRRNRRTIVLLVAAALTAALLVGGAIAVGSGLVRLHSIVPPSESPTAVVSPTPPASSTSPAPTSDNPTTPAVQVPPPTWTAAGAMTVGRYLASATLLPDGQVLVAGGKSDGGSDLASAELYDPASSSWAATGRMTTARDGHTATLLPDGRVLVVGGYTDFAALASAELYDPTTRSWASTGRMISARGYHTATLLPDGMVLVAGGRSNSSSTGGAMDTAELFDPATGKWTATGSLIEAHTFHVATLLPDGHVLVAGASLKGYDLVSDAELYDTSTGSWTATGTMITAGAYQMAVLLPSGKVLVTGGTEVDKVGCCQAITGQALRSSEVYDPGTGSWTAAASMNQGRAYGTATLLPDGRVLVVGGEGANPSVGFGTSSSTGATGLVSAELYDPGTDTWTVTLSMAGNRVLQATTLLPDGRVLVAGGASRGRALGTVELYDPGTGF